MNAEQFSMEARRLPLWKDALAKMEPLEFGKRWPTEWLERALSAKRDDVGFAAGLVKMNETIRHRGFKLVSRGQKGTGWMILPADAVADELLAEAQKAKQCYKRAIELGHGVLLNETADLSPAMRARIDHINQKNSARLALVSRRNLTVKAAKPAQLREG